MNSSRGATQSRVQLHPLLVVVAMLLFAAVLTFLVPSGRFKHHAGQVVPGSYHVVPKTSGLIALRSPVAPAETDVPAKATGPVGLFTSVPAGMVKSAKLIFMLMFVGGTFGILRATGVIDAGVEHLLHVTSGNILLLASGLFLLLACGSTFLGFSSEYVALIPVVLALGKRVGLPNLFAPIIVALADFVGYGVSVTNPIVLGIAQPLAGVPVFSGVFPRLAMFAVLCTITLAYLLLYLRRQPSNSYVPEGVKLSWRHVGVFITLLGGGGFLIVGTWLWAWQSPELAAAYVAFGIALGLAGGLRPGVSADAFLEGMSAMILPCLLIGAASAIGIILQSSQILDSIVEAIVVAIQGQAHGLLAVSMMIAEMGFGVIMPSVTAKAAVSIPIMVPVAHIAGVTPQVAVTALLLGSGMTNIISPTNPLLLAFLAAANVSYVEWAKFVAPLFVCLCIACFVGLYAMTMVDL